MKRLIFFLLAVTFIFRGHATSSIDKANRDAYAANVGWIDWVGDTNSGAVIGDYTCSGWLYSANVGWINLGSGAPVNRIYYQNNSAIDFGVNNDGTGNLSGSAWGANIGWITFEQTYGRPKVNMLTGQLTGYIWSANCGWISLSNAVGSVQTDSLFSGPISSNGLPVPWLLTYFGTTNISANADPTGKGITIAQDYMAGTDPTNASSVLRITSASFAAEGTSVGVTWSSVPTRYYYLQKNADLSTTNWIDSGLGAIAPSGSGSTTGSFTDGKMAKRFFRVQAMKPLVP